MNSLCIETLDIAIKAMETGGTEDLSALEQVQLQALKELKKYKLLEEKLTKVYRNDDFKYELLSTVIDGLTARASEVEPSGKVYDGIILTNEHCEQYRNWKALYEDGKLLELPCKVGDKIYMIICTKIVNSFISEFIFSLKFYEYNKNNFGKTIFLTREEAEKKLEEMR